MSGTTDVLATVASANGLAQEEVNVAGVTGTYVPVSSSGLGASPLVVFNWDPQTQLAGFLDALAAGQGASLVAIGDSTTLGYGAAVSGFRELSYVAEMSQVLNEDGVTAQSDNFLGQGNVNFATPDDRVTLFGGAAYAGIYDAGGQVIATSAANEGFTFTLPTAAAYNEVKLNYIDRGAGSVSVAVDGVTIGSLQFGNSGDTLSATLAIPAGLHGSITVTATSAAPTYIEGVGFVNTGSDAVQVYNAGIGGWGAANANTSVYNGSVLTGSAEGFGQVAGAVALSPKLALVDLGINDISGADNLGVPVPVSTIVANLEQIVATLRAAGSDVILVIPQPFNAPAYATELPELRAALEQFSLQANVPLIDLSATYGNSEAALALQGLMSDADHPDATLYADIGTQIAGLLANAVNGTNANAATVTGTSGNDTLSGTATVNTLVGDGGDDTYVIASSDQSDTIVNGPGGAPAGVALLRGVLHDQLWFTQSGDNLVVTVLGTDRQVIVQGWFGSDAGAALAQIEAADAQISTAGVNSLVAAMAAYASANPDFNPATSAVASLQDSSFGGTLQAAVAADWTNLPACFLVGTQIATPGGARAIETLRVGEAVTTLGAGPQKLRWIGRRTYSAAFANADAMLRPIRLAPGALAPGVPAAPLYVSPGHGLCVEGVLVHAWRLLNGVSITQPEVTESVTYLHLELDTHALLLAEGCPAESLRGEEFCLTFENAGSRPRRAAAPPPPCRPALTQGFRLEAIRARLARRAGLAPASLPAVGGLRGYVEGVSGGRLRGWARHEQAPELPVCLSIHAGGRRVAVALANLYRADVRAAGHGSGACGFELALPPGLEGKLEVRRVGDGARLRPAHA